MFCILCSEAASVSQKHRETDTLTPQPWWRGVSRADAALSCERSIRHWRLRSHRQRWERLLSPLLAQWASAGQLSGMSAYQLAGGGRLGAAKRRTTAVMSSLLSSSLSHRSHASRTKAAAAVLASACDATW